MDENNIPTHVVAILGIVQNGDKYLIARRSLNDPQEGGAWSFPGGKVEMEIEENIIENTLRREMREEVGIEIQDNVELIYNNSFTRVSGHHVVMMTYLCFYKSGTAKPLEDQEEIRWLNLEELEKMKSEMPGYTWDKIEALKKHLALGK